MSPNSDAHDPGGNLKIIDLEFETLRQFREVMAARLNYEGFFVATKEPLPRGTPARFRFLLPDGFVLVEGTAVVAWARHEDEGSDELAGMALLFNELEHQSREIIDELIDFHIATGGDPFEIGSLEGDAGDIGTDALSSDPLETKVPLPEPAPEPPSPEADKSEDVLPDWLSEVAQKHDVDLSADATVPTDQPPASAQVPETPEPTQQDFDISLMPDEEEMDPTPLYPEAEEAPDVTVPPPERKEAPRDFRLRLLLPVIAVLAAIAAAVWWTTFRNPGPTVPEPVPVVEEIPETQPPSNEAVEEPAAAAEEAAADVIDEPAGEPTGPTEEIAEPEPESPPIEEVAGPATRVLLVSSNRIGDATVVTVRTNGALSLESVKVSLLEDPPRVWVRVLGIETFYRPNDIEVLTPEIERVRIGHHPEETPQSLYVVCDLTDPAAVVREFAVEGDTLRVVVGRP